MSRVFVHGLVLLLASLLPAVWAHACEGERYLNLRASVLLDEQDREFVRNLPVLRVQAVDIPPLARYDARSKTWRGVGVDVWCYLATRLGLRYEFDTSQGELPTSRLYKVQMGESDVFLALSENAERRQHGVFSLPYYHGYYAVIGRRGRPLLIHDMRDLANYRVGILKGSVMESVVRREVPEAHLIALDQADTGAVLDKLRDGTFDAVIYNKNAFLERRYLQEYFDLEVVHVLHRFPRQYGFYFARTPENEVLAALFNRYLAVLDVSRALIAHEVGEEQLIDRYLSQRNRQLMLQTVGGFIVILILVLVIALWRYRHLSRELARSNTQILEQQEALQQAYADMERLSQTDSLTLLANRRYFEQMLSREHARQQRSDAPLSILMVDVDHFKCVNDHYGHAVGDDYLRVLARMLQDALLRSSDLVARYGGEEFICLLPETSHEDACRVAERIRQAVFDSQMPNPLAEGSRLTVSVGVATSVNASVRARELVAQADRQLYAAKRAGRNQVCSVVLGA